jgi:hypothetical protein
MSPALRVSISVPREPVDRSENIDVAPIHLAQPLHQRAYKPKELIRIVADEALELVRVVHGARRFGDRDGSRRAWGVVEEAHFSEQAARTDLGESIGLAVLVGTDLDRAGYDNKGAIAAVTLREYAIAATEPDTAHVKCLLGLDDRVWRAASAM